MERIEYSRLDIKGLNERGYIVTGSIIKDIENGSWVIYEVEWKGAKNIILCEAGKVEKVIKESIVNWDVWEKDKEEKNGKE
jgi:hypothetical protein